MSRDKNILIDVWLLASLTDRLVSEILEDSPLSVDEFAMYGLITDLAPITSADLVRATGRSPTTISSLVRRCEARGELVRTHNPDDARSSLLELTSVGYQALGEVTPRLLSAIEEIKGGLGGTYDAVRESLRELDSVIRLRLGVGARPYELETGTDDGTSLSYPGEPLTPDQAEEARRFIEWIRSRDG